MTDAPTAAPVTDTPQGALTIQEAVAKLDAQDAAAKAGPAADPKPQQEAADASTDTVDETPVDEAGEVDQEQPEDGEEPESEPEPEDTDDDPTVALPDGTEVKLSEMAKGYLRQSDYTKKTQALAEERKATEQQKQHIRDTALQIEQHLAARAQEVEAALKAAAEAREQYSKQVEAIESQLSEREVQWQRVDWNALQQRIATARERGDRIEAADAAAEYTQLWGQYQLHEQAKRAVEQEQAKTKAEREAEEAKRKDSEAKAEREARLAAEANLVTYAKTKYPDFADPAKGNALLDAMAKTAQSIGYTNAEMQQTLDRRGFDLWWKATQYDLLTAKSSGVTQQAAKQPATPPSGVRIVKGNAPRPRPSTVERGRLGVVQAAFNSAPTMENALALMNAREQYTNRKR